MSYETLKVEDGKLIISLPLFKNDKKEKDSHPDARYFDKVSGCEIAAWTKAGKNSRFQSVVIKVPLGNLPDGTRFGSGGTTGGQTGSEARYISHHDDSELNDDIPF